MNGNRTVLILYANYGEGHKRAAKAIEAKLRNDMEEDVTIHVEDYLGDAYPLSDWIMRKLYLQTFSWAKTIYQQMYYMTKDFSVDSSLFSLPSFIGSLKLERHIKNIQPNIVISTFPTITGMLAKVKDRGNVDFKLYCLLTDYVSHSQWLYQSVDRYFVPTEKIKHHLIESGIRESVIEPTGIPVMPHFEFPYEKQQLMEKWGLKTSEPVVLISAGAFGVSNVKEACEKLVESCPTIQYVVVCGRNEKLYNQLLGLKSIHPLPYTNEMHELMQLADLFVTKAGGISISEAITSEIPMVLFKSLPGQETENVKYLLRERVAKRVKSSDELVTVVTQLINDRDLLDEMKSNIKSLRQSISLSHVITDTVSREIDQSFSRMDTIRLRDEHSYEI